MKIAVMGQGYVGLPLAMAAVETGHHVVGFEPDQHRWQQLNWGTSYVEDVPSATLRAALESGRYEAARLEDWLAAPYGYGQLIRWAHANDGRGRGGNALRTVTAAARWIGARMAEVETPS
ncbi:hypothetical protein [Streptomyces sp. NPDC002159]